MAIHHTFIFILATFFSIVNAINHAKRETVPSCASVKPPYVSGARVVSIQGTERRNFTVVASPPLLNNDIAGLNVCEVDVILTHPGANDRVLVQVWLPFSGCAGSW